MKDLEYYMGLNYPVLLTQIAVNEGGGWSACIPMLGRCAFVGDGETPGAAIDDLGRVKRAAFEAALKKRIPIPEPGE